AGPTPAVITSTSGCSPARIAARSASTAHTTSSVTECPGSLARAALRGDALPRRYATGLRPARRLGQTPPRQLSRSRLVGFVQAERRVRSVDVEPGRGERLVLVRLDQYLGRGGAVRPAAQPQLAGPAGGRPGRARLQGYRRRLFDHVGGRGAAQPLLPQPQSRDHRAGRGERRRDGGPG